jgi:hypothetical protein
MAGSPACTFAGRPWPAIFGLVPEVEGVLKQINTALREGKMSADLFPTTEMVAEVLSTDTGPRADLVKRELYTVDTLQLVKYIAQLYLHCKYMGKLQYPEDTLQAVRFATTALYTEYGMLKGVRGETPEIERQQLRSLQYLWGHIGGFIMLTHFPVGWDPENALQRKMAGFDVLVKTAPEPPRPSLWPSGQVQMQGVPWGQQSAPQHNMSADWAHRGIAVIPDHTPLPGLELYTGSIVVNGEVGIDPRGKRPNAPSAAPVEVLHEEPEVGIDPRGKRPPSSAPVEKETVQKRRVAKVAHAPEVVHEPGFSMAHWNVVPVDAVVPVAVETVGGEVLDHDEIDFSDLQIMDIPLEPPEPEEQPLPLAVGKAVDKLLSDRIGANLPKLAGLTQQMPK